MRQRSWWKSGKKAVGNKRNGRQFTQTELTGGKDRALLAVEYEEKKREEELKKRASKMGLSLGEEEEEGGRKELKNLTIEHQYILALYMTGKYSQTEIARMAEVHNGTVWKVVHSKLGQELIKEWKSGLEAELDALMPLAVDAVRGALKSGDKKTKLLGVDRFVKMTGRGEPGAGVTVNIVNDARGRFIEDLRDLAEQEKVIEGEAEVVG